MPVIRISDAAFDDLIAMRKWFQTETPAQTIEKVIKEMMKHLGLERDDQNIEIAVSDSGAMIFKEDPGLSFTRVVGARISGIAIGNASWASALRVTILRLKEKGLTGEKLVAELQIPASIERREDNGYRYYEDLGISYQGQSASDAWKEIKRIAAKWGISVHLKIQWRENDKAQFPGKMGELKA